MKVKLRKILILFVICRDKFNWFSLLVVANFMWIQDRRKLPLYKSHYPIYINSFISSYLKTKRFPSLQNPESLNDIINWAKLFDQHDLTVKCSDKLSVRDYVKETIGDRFLLKVYQVGRSNGDFDVNALPESFVVKTNHDSGSVVVVQNKSKVDFDQIVRTLQEKLLFAFGWEQGEWPYSYIDPQIFIEEFYQDEALEKPADYKVQCINGQPWFVRYTYGRDSSGNGGYELVLDAEGKVQPYVVDSDFVRSDIDWSTPTFWPQLMELASALSAPFQLVRIDFYASKERLVVGEMTFFPYAGCYRGKGHKRVMELKPDVNLRYKCNQWKNFEDNFPRKRRYPKPPLLSRILRLFA